MSSNLWAKKNSWQMKSHTERTSWLESNKGKFPLLSYIPRFYDDAKIKFKKILSLPTLFDKTRLQFDFQGNIIHSQYNFTDLVEKYNDVDGWMEFKVAYWLDEKKTISPFLSFVPNFTTHTSDVFWWQNYNQLNTGLQWYPFPESKKYPFLKSIRVLAQYSSKDLYDKKGSYKIQPTDNPEAILMSQTLNQNPKSYDVQVGIDYYYDNIFSGNPMALSIWSSLAWYKTNFTTLNLYESSSGNKDYSAIIFKGDIKYGFVKRWREGILFPYLVASWAYSPRYSNKERFSDNHLRTGIGMRYYPVVHKAEEESVMLWKNLMKRFYIFGEFLYNAAWLGDEPMGKVNDIDYRFGLGYSTTGFYRDKGNTKT